MKDLKIKYNETFGTKRSRDYYRGLSFHFSGKWLVGVHYFSDDYVIDFVTINNCLLACAKSHLSLEENKPTEFIVDDKGDITGVVSQYWDFVCAGLHGDPIEIRYNEETGELEVRTSVSDWTPIVKIPQALQELGNSEKDTISQKVITEELATKLDIDDAVFEKGTGTNSAQQKNCGNDARGSRSFAHGDHNMAMEGGAHAEGSYTVANAIGSHTEGQSTLATNQFEHAEGKFNKSNNGTLHSVGIGADAQHRTNAFEIMQNGDVYVKGVGNYEGNNLKTDPDNPSNTVQEVIESLENDSVFEAGAGTNSVQQKEVGAKAISESSVAIGKNSVSGLKGFYYKHIQRVGSSGTIVNVFLSTIQVTPTMSNSSVTKDTSIKPSDFLETGDILSIINDSKYYECLEIINFLSNGGGIQAKWIGSAPFNSISAASTPYTKEDYSIFCLSKPNAGISDLADSCITMGAECKSVGGNSVALGYKNETYGKFGFSEGRENKAGYAAHAEGQNTQANGTRSHSEGYDTIAEGNGSHAEGQHTKTVGQASHAEGYYTQTLNGVASHAEGKNTVANGDSSHAEGEGETISFTITNVEEIGTNATVFNVSNSTTQYDLQHGDLLHYKKGSQEIWTSVFRAETNKIIVVDRFTPIPTSDGTLEVVRGIAYGNNSHSENAKTTAVGENSHSEGFLTNTRGFAAHTEGVKTKSDGWGSHSEGELTEAIGEYSHAEGKGTKVEGRASHAEGENTTVIGAGAHSEGYGTTVESGADFSHVEGFGSQVSAVSSHAEGYLTTIPQAAQASHTEGYMTEVKNMAEHAEGRCNKSNTVVPVDPSAPTPEEMGKATLHSVGMGYPTNPNDPSTAVRMNAFEIMQNGDAYLLGVGNYNGTNPSSATPINELIGKSNVFWATYNSTTYQEIVNAYNAGKLVACRYDNNNYTLTTLSNAGSAWFGGAMGAIFRLRCNISDSSWGADTYYTENTSNRKNSMPANPDNYTYLSAKAVADYVNDIVGDIETLLAAL